MSNNVVIEKDTNTETDEEILKEKERIQLQLQLEIERQDKFKDKDQVVRSISIRNSQFVSHNVDPLIPPFRFAIIEEGIFRGSYPTERNLRFLKRLKLKTIVSLTPKPPSKPFLQFCERYGIISKHFPVSKFKDDVTVSSAQVVQLLELMINESNLPLYLHCLDGANVTGTIFMCLRKLQNWSLSAIISEFTRYTRGSCISSSESEFVETFKAEIDVPIQIPTWLWNGVRMTKHPTLKLRLVTSHLPPLTSNTAQITSIATSLLAHQQSFPQQLQQQLQQQQQQHGSALSTSNEFHGTPVQYVSPLSHSSSSLIVNSQSGQHTPNILGNSGGIGIGSVVGGGSGGSATGSFVKIDQVNPLSSTTSPRVGTNILASPQYYTTGIPSISSLLTNTKEKEKDKKKKIEEIKLQFDAGKFNQGNLDSKTLDALALEKTSQSESSQNHLQQHHLHHQLKYEQQQHQQQQQIYNTPTANRILQTSSQDAFSNIDLSTTFNQMQKKK